MIVDLHLKGNLVIIVGAGAEGLKKINSLLTQDCKILVISEESNPQIQRYVKAKKIQFKKMKLKNGSFLSKFKPYLVMATTDDRELNRKIVKKAKAMKCFAYASDDPEFSDFAHPSVINIEDTVQVAVSTGGKSPVMARKIKQEAEKIFRKTIKKEDILQINLQEKMREAAKKKIGSQKERKKYLYSIIKDEKIKQLIKDNKFKMAQKRAMVLLRDWK
ncbi:MAG: bifunctional precorrin-2 dehydrogenase/sirohydrochlorin ferrochelatase [Nitrosopumilaceae archaeon]|nr:bifunctional precorrin-2 dehydrogenase/sirohydrochlorin ferrochelatase [Nitrosopumilaceae archaeon]